MVESDIEIILNERDIKTFPVVCDDHFVFVNLINEVIQVLPLHIGFNLVAVIKGNGGYWMVMAIQSGGFDIQVRSWIPEIREKSPGLIWWQLIEKYPGLFWYKCCLDSSIPFCNKYFRPTDNGIEISSENASQWLRPDSQSFCSVIAPIPWMWMNVFWSMTKSISGFC